MISIEIPYKLDMDELYNEAEDALDDEADLRSAEVEREFNLDEFEFKSKIDPDDLLNKCCFDEEESEFYNPTLRDYQNYELYKRFGFDLDDNRYLDDKAKQVIRVIERLWLTNRLDESKYAQDEAFIAYIVERNKNNEVYHELMDDAINEIKCNASDVIDDIVDDLQWEKDNN